MYVLFAYLYVGAEIWQKRPDILFLAAFFVRTFGIGRSEGGGKILKIEISDGYYLWMMPKKRCACVWPWFTLNLKALWLIVPRLEHWPRDVNRSKVSLRFTNSHRKSIVSNVRVCMFACVRRDIARDAQFMVWEAQQNAVRYFIFMDACEVSLLTFLSFWFFRWNRNM